MREVSVDAAVEIPHTATLTDTAFENAVDRPDLVVYSRKVEGEWRDVTSRQFRDEVAALAKGLIASGVEAGDRIGLMSRTRYEWTLCDYAIWAAGAVTVPIYETSSVDQIEWILSDSGAKAIFVETAEHETAVDKARKKAPDVKSVWLIESAAPGDGASAVEELGRAGQSVDDDVLESRRRDPGADGLATIVYTSGTTGRPKGCELTHRNLLFYARNVHAGGMDDVYGLEDSSTLLFLPLAHSFARIIQVGSHESGVRLGHASDVKNLLADLAAFRPRFILAVPRIFEKVYNSAAQKATADGKGRIFELAAKTAITYSEALDGRPHSGPGIPLRVAHTLFDRLVYGKLRAALGGQVQYAVSGGAPLGSRLGHFFRGIGVTVLEGYGLTESSAGATVNLPSKLKIGTVGRAFPGVSIRIDESGEILLKGDHIFRGYWNNPEATAESFEDGWLRTGDIGELDEDGYLRITGRIKDLIVTASGKNVAPAVLEDRLRAHPLVSQCVVVGDRRPYVGALVTLDPEALAEWAKTHEKGDATPSGLRDDPDVVQQIQSAVDEANKAVSTAESIRRFRILDVDFTEESGHLTPSMKVKRAAVFQDFGDEIEALYA